MQKDIFKQWFFLQQPHEVWEYLTDAALIEQWLAKTDFKPIVGHKFQFTNTCATTSGQQNHTYCEVLKVVPHRLLSYSWRKGHNENELSVDSVVTWTLSKKNGGTELQLQHNGFVLLADTIAHSEGWDACMNKITELINIDKHAIANA